MGVIVKSQAKYLSGYRKAMDLISRDVAITDYAFNTHRRLVKGALKRKVVITLERETYFCGKVSRGDPNSAYPCYIEVNVEPEAQESHCSCMLFQEEGFRCEHIIALLRKKDITPRTNGGSPKGITLTLTTLLIVELFRLLPSINYRPTAVLPHLITRSQLDDLLKHARAVLSQ